MEQFKYPVVCFFADGHLNYARNYVDLSESNLILLNNGLYKDLIIIDSDGKKHKIISVEKRGTRGFLWGISILNLQNIYISFTTDENIEELSLEEFRKEIFKRHRQHGRIIGGNLFKEDLKIIKNAITIKEIIECGCNWFFETFPT